MHSCEGMAGKSVSLSGPATVASHPRGVPQVFEKVFHLADTLAGQVLAALQDEEVGIFRRRLSAFQIAVGISGTSSSVPTMASMREMPMAPR